MFAAAVGCDTVTRRRDDGDIVGGRPDQLCEQLAYRLQRREKIRCGDCPGVRLAIKARNGRVLRRVQKR
jgi:hypothetical protein